MCAPRRWARLKLDYDSVGRGQSRHRLRPGMFGFGQDGPYAAKTTCLWTICCKGAFGIVAFDRASRRRATPRYVPDGDGRIAWSVYPRSGAILCEPCCIANAPARDTGRHFSDCSRPWSASYWEITWADWTFRTAVGSGRLCQASILRDRRPVSHQRRASSASSSTTTSNGTASFAATGREDLRKHPHVSRIFAARMVKHRCGLLPNSDAIFRDPASTAEWLKAFDGGRHPDHGRCMICKACCRIRIWFKTGFLSPRPTIPPKGAIRSMRVAGDLVGYAGCARAPLRRAWAKHSREILTEAGAFSAEEIVKHSRPKEQRTAAPKSSEQAGLTSWILQLTANQESHPGTPFEKSVQRFRRCLLAGERSRRAGFPAHDFHKAMAEGGPGWGSAFPETVRRLRAWRCLEGRHH